MNKEINRKLIDLDKITKKELLVWFNNYAKSLKIKLSFVKADGHCYAYPTERIIQLDIWFKRFTKKKLAFAFFHEIGHIHIYDNGLFPEVNHNFSNLKLEKWCDNFGERESKKYFKNPDCYKPYHKAHGKVFIKKNNKEIREYYKSISFNPYQTSVTLKAHLSNFYKGSPVSGKN